AGSEAGAGPGPPEVVGALRGTGRKTMPQPVRNAASVATARAIRGGIRTRHDFPASISDESVKFIDPHLSARHPWRHLLECRNNVVRCNMTKIAPLFWPSSPQVDVAAHQGLHDAAEPGILAGDGDP